MKYIIPYKIFENDSLPNPRVIWDKYNDIVQELEQYFTKYWHMKVINRTPSPNKEENLENTNPFISNYNMGESEYFVRLETDNEFDYLTYDFKCKIKVRPIGYSKPYYSKNEVIVELDIDGNVKDNDGPIKDRVEQRQFLFLKLLNIERFDGVDKGITTVLNNIKNKGYTVTLKLCPGISKINPNLISRGISLGKMTEDFFRMTTIQEYTRTCYKLASYLIYYNDDSVIKSWWDALSHSTLSLKVIESVSKDKEVYNKLKNIIGDDKYVKDMTQMGFAD